MSNDLNRVLSIQSHVVHGYVGNKSAVFPLQASLHLRGHHLLTSHRVFSAVLQPTRSNFLTQLHRSYIVLVVQENWIRLVLGFEVDNINSVQFSNHTGYSNGFKGQVLNEKELAELFSGLMANDLHNQYTHLLTGYVGNPTFLKEIANILKTLRSINPSLIYVCDPVMGDDGIMYVPKELLPIYRDEIVPLADIVTPNQFEVELLTGKTISSEQDAWDAIQWFHNKGVKTVAISSSELGGSNSLIALVSHKEGNKSQRCRMVIPKQGNGIRFTGTGDLFAALFLAHSTLTKFDMSTTLERTIASLQSVISKTLEYIPEDVKTGKTVVTSTQRELKIIQSKQDIEQPKVTCYCSKV